MAKVSESSVIPAPISEVWELVGKFAAIHAWCPAVIGTTMQDGPSADQVGAIRECDLGGGAKVLDHLTARSDADHTCSYAITESPMPMTNYVGTMRLRPITDGNQTLFEWEATFDPAPGAEDELSGMLVQVYQGGFDNLKARFAGS